MSASHRHGLAAWDAARGHDDPGACPRCGADASAARAAQAGLAALALEPAEPPPPRIFAAVEQALARGEPRPRRAAAPFFAVALAACALLALGAFELARPRLVRAGERVSADGAGLRLRLACGAQLTLTGVVQIASSNPSGATLRLERGTVRVQVPHLGDGAFVVEAGDATVRVHGTKFEVVRGPGGAAVAVEEGRVEVQPAGRTRAPLMLGPGARASVPSLDAFRASLREEAAGALDSGRPGDAVARLDLLVSEADTAAEAGEALSLRANAELAAGSVFLARSDLSNALETLPAGVTPLWAENASAELALLDERALDFEGAARAWRYYLARFPDGAHRALAEAHLRGAR